MWRLACRLTAAHADPYFSRRNVRLTEPELHLAGFPGTQMNSLKAAQAADGIV
jgi:hypothetical protein